MISEAVNYLDLTPSASMKNHCTACFQIGFTESGYVIQLDMVHTVCLSLWDIVHSLKLLQNYIS